MKNYFFRKFMSDELAKMILEDGLWIGEKHFVAPQQGILPQGINTINRYTPDFNIIEERLLESGKSCYAGYHNPIIGEDINSLRKFFREKYGESYGYLKTGLRNEFPFVPTNPRTKPGLNAQEITSTKYKYVKPTSAEILTNADSVYFTEHTGNRIFRIDAIDNVASKATKFEKYESLRGTDAGELKSFGNKILGEDAFVSVPKDSGFNRYVTNINGGEVKVKHDDKRLRKFLKKNHKLVNGLDRSTLEFIYGSKNPNIEKMIRNARRVL